VGREEFVSVIKTRAIENTFKHPKTPTYNSQTGIECLDGKRNDQMALHALADYQNHVIGWLQRE
jgi:hypothetical protein